MMDCDDEYTDGSGIFGSSGTGEELSKVEGKRLRSYELCEGG